MIFATFNANSLKNRLETIICWMKQTGCACVAVQETKCQDVNFPKEILDEAGLFYAYRGEKTFNGVCLISKYPLENVELFIGDLELDSQTRFVKADINGVTVINTYIPQGQDIASPKFEFKLKYLEGVKKYIADNYTPEDKVLWMGDFNIALTDLDVYEPQAHWGQVGYNEFEQNALKSITDWGLYDTFRKHHENEPNCFTFWDYRLFGALKRNLGWRIDYIMATKALYDACILSEVDREPRKVSPASDHTFLYSEFSI